MFIPLKSKQDCLDELRKLCETKNMSIEITNQARIGGTDVKMDPPYFRSINEEDYWGEWE